MKKFCVFCGERPKDKNKEHVLPRWLIALTGDPKRIAGFGPDFLKRSARRFAFDELTFPACAECNADFAVLEGGAEQVVRKLLGHQAVPPDELMLLLDWLDKVRVGMWLGYFYLDKNMAGIEPRFHIIQRLGLYDRMVGIINVEKWSQGLRFVGPVSRFFQLSPTCFGLGINDLFLVSASGISLCSRRLGLPYLQPVGIRADGQVEVSLNRGFERMRYPVERSASLPDAVLIYQPVFGQFLKSDIGREYLTSEWVKKHTPDHERGLGRLFLQRDGSVRAMSDNATLHWLPSKSWKPWELVGRLNPYVYRRLRRDFEDGLALYASNKVRKSQRSLASMARRIDDSILKRIREEADRIRRADLDAF